MQLHEQYRPKSWAEVVGQPAALKAIGAYRQRGLAGRVFWITGPSGAGKTTIARLIAAEVADDWAVCEINAADLDIDTVRQWERDCRTRPLGRGQWVFIVNEAHRLRSAIIARLNTTFEMSEVERNSTWIFTTTLEGHKTLWGDEPEAVPFRSRLAELRLAVDSELDFALRCRQIAQAEGLDGQPLDAYVRLVRACSGNMRAMLGRIEAGGMKEDR